MPIRLITFISLLTISISYSQNKISTGMLQDDQMLFSYVVYFLGEDNIEESEAKYLLNEKYSLFSIVDSIPDPDEVKEPLVNITHDSNVREEFPPQTLEFLEFTARGMTIEDKLALQRSERAMFLHFVCTKDQLPLVLKTAHEYIDELLLGKSAIVFDTETSESLSHEYWKQYRLVTNEPLDISNHITIHLYQKTQYCRAITLGMLKFGLPDIVIENLSCKSGMATMGFINLTAQTFYENKKLENEGELPLNVETIRSPSMKQSLMETSYENAVGSATIKFKDGKWEQGDPYNDLLEIAFSEENPQIEHDEVIKFLFGYEDEVSTLTHDDELLQASERAKAKIPELFELFSNGLDVNRHLLIKFPFETEDGQREWMWVEITEWEAEEVKGLLQNEPALVTHVKSGQLVTKDINLMFDYIIYNEDGTQEGNETVKIMMKRGY